MWRLPEGVAISVVVHVALVAAVAGREPGERTEPPTPTAVPIEIVAVASPHPSEPPPLEVAILDPPVAAVAERPRDRRAAIATAATARAAVEEPGPAEPAPATRSPYFDMRKGQTIEAAGAGARIDLRLPAGLRDDLDHVPAGTSPDAGPTTTGLLHESGGGTHRSELGPFVVKVDPEGGVTINDRKNFRFGLKLPTPQQIGQGVTDWYRSDKGPDGKRGKRTLEKSVGGSIDAGNEVTNDSGDRSRTVIVPMLGGGFDVTDAFMRSKGVDPYAAAKLRYLDATRDERVQIGTKHRAQQLLQVNQIMTRNLDRLWSSTSDLAARKQGLFELWDECVETGDPLVVEAARSARKLVVAFIRGRLPAASVRAYTAEELAAFNRRKQSTATFAPYD